MVDERRVVVRFAGEPDLIVASGLTIGEIKQLIFSQRPAYRGKHLRIIHAGRVLDDTTRVPVPEPGPEPSSSSSSSSSTRETGSLPEDIRPNGKGRPANGGNASTLAMDVKGKGTPPLESNGNGSPHATNPASSQTIYLHCAVSDFASEAQTEPPLRPQLGLERLLSVGFSEDEVANIRAQFHALRGTNIIDEESARRLEESWIDANQNNAVADNPFFGNSPGDLLAGLMIGFFLGILSLLLIREPFFNRRVQFGVVVGLLFNASFGIARML